MKIISLCHPAFLSSSDDYLAVGSRREVLEELSKSEDYLLLLCKEDVEPDFIKAVKEKNKKCRMALLIDNHSIENDLFRDIFSMEYIHDLIYGHLERLSQLQPILTLMYFDLKPRIVLTIVFDNFWAVCENRDNSYRYRLKRILLNHIRRAMEQGMKGVATTLIGTDKVVVVLDCGVLEGAEAEAYAASCAEEIRCSIIKSTGFSVSIGVSKDCSNLALMWKAYEQSFRALEDSFRQGNGRVLRYRQPSSTGRKMKGSEKAQIQQELIWAISTQDEEACLAALEHFTVTAAMQDMNESYAKSMAASLLSETAKYGVRLGLDSNKLSEHIIVAIDRIFKAGTMEEVKREMLGYALKLSRRIRDKTRVNGAGNGILDVAKAYMEQYYMEELTLRDMADLCGYSTSHFSRSFKECFGIKFVQYLMQVRVEQAKELLRRTELSVEMIAEKTGFQSLSYFCSSFKKETGMTPNQFRESGEL